MFPHTTSFDALPDLDLMARELGLLFLFDSAMRF